MGATLISRKKSPARMLGRFIVADPDVCHGKPTFVGTRIPVADVLIQVASGTPWERIVKGTRGVVTPEAISEASMLAVTAFLDHQAEYAAKGLLPERR